MMNKSELLEISKPSKEQRSINRVQEQHSVQWSTERLDRMYNVPASWKETMIHKQASKFGYKIGKILKEGKQEIVPVCPCCNNLVANYQIPLSYSTSFHNEKEMPNLLPPQSLIYFLFVKAIILLLAIRFLLCDLYIIYLSTQGRYCSNLHLMKSKKELCSFTISAVNLKSSADQQNFVYIDISSVTFTLISLYLLVKLDKQIKKIFDCMVNDHRPPQNTFVKSYQITQFVRDERCNNPASISESAVDLQTFVKTASDNKEAKNIVSINLSYNPAIIQVIQKQRNMHKDSRQIQRQINKNFVQICKHYAGSKDQVFYLANFTGKLTFTRASSNKSNQNCFEAYQSKTKDYFGHRIDSKINYLSAIQVDWYQTDDTHVSGQINKTLLGMLIFLTFMALLGLQKWKINEKELGESGIKEIFFLIVSVVTTFVVNSSLAGFILHLANKQKYKTIRQKKQDLFQSTVVSQFCIVVLLSGIIYLIYPTNKLSDAGLIIKMLGIVGVNGVLSQILRFIIPNVVQKYKKRQEVEQKVQGFQKDANKSHQLQEFRYWQNYIFYIVHTILVSFYSILIPIASALLILVFISQYWIDKYNLFRRSAVSHETPQCVSFIYQACFRLAYFAVLAFAVSHWIWGMEINYDQTVLFRMLKFINILIALCFLVYFCRRDKLEQKLGQHQKADSTQERYQYNSYFYYKTQNLIVKTYENQNPLTFCRKHKITRNIPHVGVETIESQNGNFISEQQFDKYLSLSSDQMLFPVWNYSLNKFIWIQQAELKENFDYQKHHGLEKHHGLGKHHGLDKQAG